MLTAYTPNNQSLQVHQGGRFIEKIFTDQAGQQFKLVFFVALINGEVKGTLVSAQPMQRRSDLGMRSGRGQTSAEVLYLPISIPKNDVVTEYIPAYVPVISPFNELFFFTSQPTRAPSL